MSRGSQTCPQRLCIQEPFQRFKYVSTTLIQNEKGYAKVFRVRAFDRVRSLEFCEFPAPLTLCRFVMLFAMILDQPRFAANKNGKVERKHLLIVAQGRCVLPFENMAMV